MVSHLGLYSLPAFGCRGLGLSMPISNLAIAWSIGYPTGSRRVAASHRLNLNGANPINALIEVPQGKSLHDPETLAAIAEVSRKQLGIANVWSLEALRRWLAEKMGK
jgi:hypothetical protein